MKNKRGDTYVLETTFFIILNVIFFVMMLVFVNRAASGAVIYEQTYAKQIALLLDDAKPGTTISLNMDKGVEIAKENKIAVDKIVEINEKENRVKVSLTGKGGYSFQYFSDYSIEIGFTENFLVLKIKEGAKNE